MGRKKKTIHYIYKTTCNITERWYIGMHSTSNLDDGYMGSGTILRHSIRKYGLENHTKEILEFLPTREALVLREREIVNKELIGDGKCMNLKEGGYGGFVNEEHMKKCSKGGNEAKTLKMKNDEEFRNKIQERCRKNIEMARKSGKATLKGDKNPYQNWNGKRHSDESKQKMSNAHKGKGIGEKNSQYGTCWITKDGANKKIKKEDLETYLKEGWLKGRK